MELKRLDHYEPGTKLIALFPVSVYKSTSPQTTSVRGTKMSAGEVVTVHGDDVEKWGGLAIQWRGLHYLVYARGDFAVAPEPHQVAWLMVDHNIAKGRIDRLQARVDEQAADLGGRLAELREAYLKACREKQDLQAHCEHTEAQAEFYKTALETTTQVMKGEQDQFRIALDYLEKIRALAGEADEIFNLSGSQDPDV